MPFIAGLVKEHHNEDHDHGRKLTVRLIGEQAIQLARYSYRLLESLRTKDESKEEEIKLLVLCKIAQLLRDAATPFNKVHVKAAEVLQLKEICQTYFNIYAIFLPEALNVTVWTLAYAIPYHADLLFKEFKIRYGIISLQAKESKHAAIKYDLTLSNRSRPVDTNRKWFQVMRSNYVRAFYLPEHHPLPSMYVSHFTSRVPPNFEQKELCLCSRPRINGEDIFCERSNSAESLIMKSALEGFLSDEVLAILKPVVCAKCKERFPDVATLEVHAVRQHDKNMPKTKSTLPKHVRSLKVGELKAELRKRNLAVSGGKDILVRRLEGALSSENN